MKMNRVDPRLLASGLLLAGAASVFAHGGATGIVGERMAGMMMLSEQIKLLAPIASQPTQADVQAIATAAEMIKMHAGRSMTDLFPQGSIEGPSEAKPEIWANWQTFSDYADRLAELGTELGTSADELVKSPSMPTPEPVAVRAQLSQWEQMDFEWLMGLSTEQVASIDMATTGSIHANSEPLSEARPVAAVYADIAATCAACHTAFRR
ncbi:MULTISPECIES: cytochrome c [Devosia]|uniref:Cytochrome c n=1 Tax=Devosia sediminis TaxID=2798801 RepID=A0A934IYZ6_9HYPH|nr:MULTISPECIES: cytochrome c [Devosia]MBE7734318.1 cytochrome c [Devosia faecipullorum]MBJ3787027.1 cytochrome c [Devosia sediminis]